MFGYVVTAHKPSVVTHSVVGNFTSPEKRDLLLARSTRIELYSISREGLIPLVELPINGVIVVMRLVRPPGEDRDNLMILTQRNKFCVLRWNITFQSVDTVCLGDMKDKLGQQYDGFPIGVADPQLRCFALHLYETVVKIVPGDFKKEAYPVRIAEKVRDIQFLEGTAKPTICILYQDNHRARHLKTLEIVLKEKDVAEGPFHQQNLEQTANMLVPVSQPLGGVLVFAENSITYLNGSAGKSTFLSQPAHIRAVGKIDDDGSRYLIGDHAGRLSILALERKGDEVIALTVSLLGVTSLASTISYIDNGYVYVGSAVGDSQLIRLITDPDPCTEHYFEVIETYTNLGPILDFVVVDPEKHGQGQVVTCSGVLKDGSLRVIRNGISVSGEAEIEVPGIKAVFTLKRKIDDPFHSFIFQSFIGETRVYELVEEEMIEAMLDGIVARTSTIFAANMERDLAVQVVESGVILLDSQTMNRVGSWTPHQGCRILVAKGNSHQVLLSTTQGHLIYLELDPVEPRLIQVSQILVEKEISCMDLSPLGSNPRAKSKIAVIGLWKEVSIKLLLLPELATITTELLGGETIARSVLLCTMDHIDHLLVALGDGHLWSYKLGMTDVSSVIQDRRRFSIGTQPATLSQFRSRDSWHVFASSDRPTVIHVGAGKMLCSNVNLRGVVSVAGFDTEGFQDCLAIATEKSLMIGRVDDIQKLHIRTVPLGQSPHRLVHLEDGRAFAVSLSGSIDPNGNSDEVEADEQWSIAIINDSTMEREHTVMLEPDEWAQALCRLPATKSDPEYLVVGTAFIFPGEEESHRGRILVYRLEHKQLVLIAEKEVPGGVLCVTPFYGKILAGVTSRACRVRLFRWTGTDDGSYALSEDCSHSGHIAVLQIKSKGDYIVTADLMRSVSLLAYKPVGGAIEEIARDYDGQWMTAVEILDADTYLGAESSYNFFALKRTDGTVDNLQRLEKIGYFHIGEIVGTFQHGSLIMSLPENESLARQTIIFGSASGLIGLVARLDEEIFRKLELIQGAVNQVLRGVGGLDHSEFRSYVDDRNTFECMNFVDGDLVERYLDLPKHDMEMVAKQVDSTPEELTKLIEELARLH